MTGRIGSNRGQAIIEFAFALPLLCILLLGIIEFGVLFYDKAVITNASRQGARTGIAFRADGPGGYSPVTQTEIQTAVDDYLRSRLITFGGTATATTTAARTGTSPQFHIDGGTVDVQVTYQHTYLALAKWAGWGDTINISSRTIMRLQ
jgi:Flp pilus assembly protein TadG